MANSLRQSLDLIKTVKPNEDGYEQLQHEIMAERASSLGTAEMRVIGSMERLNALEGGEDRNFALAEARHAVWAYFVQRELSGFRRHQDVIRHLGITREVLNGLGAAHTAPARRK